jgi:hypothetical protein
MKRVTGTWAGTGTKKSWSRTSLVLIYISIGRSQNPIISFFLILANTEKRNLAKAQNAQRKEEIQKRLEKVQTQLGTKTKQSSASSLTKRGLLTKTKVLLFYLNIFF